MTYVYLNYENMKSVIKSINNYADRAERGKTSVASINFTHHYCADLSGINGWDDKIQALRDKAKEIDDRVELAKHQSEDGLSPKDGVNISYYVPDGMDDTSENVRHATSGLDYAKAIQDALNNGKDKYGRTVEQIVTDTASFQDDPAFSAAYIDKIGIENLPQLALDVDRKAGGYSYSAEGVVTLYEESKSHAGRRIADAFGHMMASGSSTWSDEEASEKADKLASSLKNKYGNVDIGRASVINYMFGASEYVDSDGDGTTEDRGVGLVYGNQKFLVEMGNQIEKLPTQLPDYNGDPYIGEAYNHPLQGLVHVMSRNPEAGTRWLSPPLDENASEDEHRQADKNTADRVRKMMAYNTVGDNQWTDDWMVLAAKAAQKANSNNPIPGDANGASSAATVSAIFNAVGESGEYVTLSDTSRVLTAHTLAYYPVGLDESAQASNENGVYTKGPGEATWAAHRGRQPILSDLALSNLMGQVGMNDSASLSLSAAQANFNQERIRAEVENAKETGDYSGLADAYNAQSSTNGFTTGAIARMSEHEKADSDARTKFWIDSGANVVNAVPVASELSSAAKAAVSAGRAQATASGKESLMDLVASEEAKEAQQNHDEYTRGKAANRVMVTESVLKSGAYTKEQLAKVSGNTGTNSESVLSSDGTVNLDSGGLSDSQYSDLKEISPLLFRAQKDPGSGSTDLAIPALENLDQKSDQAYEDAYRAAKPKDSKGKDITPEANKH